MAFEPLATDTPIEVERRQVEGWRRMTPSEKAAIVTGMTAVVFDLAMAGVGRRHPGASPRELFLRRAIVIHGRELAVRAYPDIEALGLE
ncbi:MAG: hypothetical protein AB7O32_03160 [Vicinamibacterales bacterium]